MCLCVCVCPCMINWDVSLHLWPSQCCAQLETLLGIGFYGLQGLCLLSVCSSLMCVRVCVSVSFNSCSQSSPDTCNHSFQLCPTSSVSLTCLYSNLCSTNNFLSDLQSCLASFFLSPLNLSFPLLCRCTLCRISSRSVLNVPRGRALAMVRNQKGNPACRLQTLRTATITTTTVVALCDSGLRNKDCKPADHKPV